MLGLSEAAFATLPAVKELKTQVLRHGFGRLLTPQINFYFFN